MAVLRKQATEGLQVNALEELFKLLYLCRVYSDNVKRFLRSYVCCATYFNGQNQRPCLKALRVQSLHDSLKLSLLLFMVPSANVSLPSRSQTLGLLTDAWKASVRNLLFMLGG